MNSSKSTSGCKSPVTQSCRMVTQRVLSQTIHRRLGAALLFMPILLLILIPPISMLFVVLSKISPYPSVTIALSSFSTFYIRRAITQFAPTVKQRREALRKCQIRLPIIATFLSVGLCRYVLHPIVRLVLRVRYTNETMDRNVNPSWEGGWIHPCIGCGLQIGVYLSVSTLALSAAIYSRYIGIASIGKILLVPRRMK